MKTRWWLVAMVAAAGVGGGAGRMGFSRPAPGATAELAALRAELAELRQAHRAAAGPAAPPARPAAPEAMAAIPEFPVPSAPESHVESVHPPAPPPGIEQELAGLKARQAEALEREGERIEERMARTTDPNELAILVQLEEKLGALETVQERMERATTDAERLALTREIQPLIGAVLQLNQADRQYRLTELARALGLTDGAATTRLMQETEAIYRETQRDLSPFLARGGPFQPSAPEPFRTTPPPPEHPHP